jgi:uncharacterized DUF497 family protein
MLVYYILLLIADGVKENGCGEYFSCVDYAIYYGYNIYVNDEIELEWDEAKRQQTLKERGLDFKLARYILSDPDLVRRIDDKKDYKETRYIAYGMAHGQVFKLCYTMRGDVYRIISLHKIHKKEQEKYYGQDGQNERRGN